MTDQPPEPRRPWNLDAIAIALIAVGALVTVLCGSCTGYFAGSALWDVIVHPEAGGGRAGGIGMFVLIAAGLVGGLPTVGGVVLLMVGIGRARRRGKPPSRSD